MLPPSSAREMLMQVKRYADGGDVSSAGLARALASGTPQEQYYQNIRDYVAKTANPLAALNAASENGVSREDINRALGKQVQAVQKQAALVSEAGVETAAADLHRLQEIVQRCGLVALAPEQHQRLVRGVGSVEFQRSGHACVLDRIVQNDKRWAQIVTGHRSIRGNGPERPRKTS